MVVGLSAVWRARSSALQRMSARAARIWALVSGGGGAGDIFFGAPLDVLKIRYISYHMECFMTSSKWVISLDPREQRYEKCHVDKIRHRSPRFYRRLGCADRHGQ